MGAPGVRLRVEVRDMMKLALRRRRKRKGMRKGRG